MTECQEVAQVILSKMLQRPKTMEHARYIVKLFVPNETIIVRDNIAEALIKNKN